MTLAVDLGRKATNQAKNKHLDLSTVPMPQGLVRDIFFKARMEKSQGRRSLFNALNDLPKSHLWKSQLNDLPKSH